MTNCTCTSIAKTPSELKTYDCTLAWDLISSGNTKGIFQLEGNLGQAWSRKMRPRNIEDLAMLIAIIRPGVLNSGMAQRLIDIRNGEIEPSYLHTSLQPILEPTYSCLVYQEQAIRIVTDLAGFTLAEADYYVRKGIAKKIPAIISELKQVFIDKCQIKGIITEANAREIFDWIKEGQRYSFNKSHSVCYAIGGYWTAYYKAHTPLEFFTSYLEFSREKIKPLKEVRELVNNCKFMKIDVKTPNILNREDKFFIKDGAIHFDLSHIKGVGISVIGQLRKYVEEAENKLNKPLKDFSWLELLVLVLTKVKKDAIIQIIKAGGFDHFKGSRKAKQYQFNKIKLLTDKELEKVIDNLASITDVEDLFYKCANGGLTKTSKRAKILGEALEQLKNPSFSLEDSIEEITRYEMETLGVPINFNLIESRNSIMAVHTCEDITNRMSGMLSVAATIESIRFTKTKNGDEMCFLEVSDNTGSVNNIVVFPQPYSEYKNMIIENNTIILVGKNKESSFITEKIYQT